MSAAQEPPLSGLNVGLFEARFKDEFANLVRKHGGNPVVAPAMVEAPLALGDEVKSFITALCAGQIDAFLVLTGVGQRKLGVLVEPILSRDQLRDAMLKTVVAARGPKAVNALKELGVKPQVVAPEPHTWQDLLAALLEYCSRADPRASTHMPLSGKRLALQQYGVPHERLTRALEERGASVMQVPVYRWQLPEDLSPLEHLIDEICAGRIELLLFTAAPQAGALIEVAAKLGREDAVRAALARSAIGSVGPSCTEGLRNLELDPDFEPEHGKMGHLVLEAARKVRQVLAHKRGV